MSRWGKNVLPKPAVFACKRLLGPLLPGGSPAVPLGTEAEQQQPRQAADAPPVEATFADRRASQRSGIWFCLTTVPWVHLPLRRLAWHCISFGPRSKSTCPPQLTKPHSVPWPYCSWNGGAHLIKSILNTHTHTHILFIALRFKST